jgi:hypothetical protein
MSSLRRDETGVDNTIFVSTKGRARHAPRIKIAIDPPDSFNATSKTASMAFHDYSVTGAYVPPRLVEQATRFMSATATCFFGIGTQRFQRVRCSIRSESPTSGGT